MLKASLAFINFTGLIIIGWFTANVSVSDNLPSNIDAGSFATVEVKINKADVQGFAKLQLDIPAGLSVSPIDTKGASFTFSGGKAKFIWMTLPQESEFVISYKLKTFPETSGEFSIGGIFSYIEENNRVDFNLQAKKVIVGSGEMAQTFPDSAKTETPYNESATEVNEVIAENIPLSSNPGDDRTIRVITPLNNGTYQVKVSIQGTSATGYAKIEERLNPAYSVVSKNSGGSVFTYDKGLVKFVWFDAPQAEKLEVVYQVTAAQIPIIEGDFFFVENNAPSRIAIANSSAISEPIATITEEKSQKIEESAPIQEKIVESTKVSEPIETEVKLAVVETKTIKEKDFVAPKTTTSPKTETTPLLVTQKEIQTESVAAKSTIPIKEKAVEPKMNIIPKAEKGITYKVQIVAGPNTVGKTYFNAKHGFSENFNIENHDGWVKYTTGSHDAYASARNDRERISKSYTFDGPFVTAYNNGERITVQEALMVTQQQWLP